VRCNWEHVGEHIENNKKSKYTTHPNPPQKPKLKKRIGSINLSWATTTKYEPICGGATAQWF
jgi:hypothetical protein